MFWLTHLQIMNIEMNCVGLVEGNVNQKSKKKHKGSSVIRLTRCWFDCCGQLDQTLSAGFDVNGQWATNVLDEWWWLNKRVDDCLMAFWTQSGCKWSLPFIKVQSSSSSTTNTKTTHVCFEHVWGENWLLGAFSFPIPFPLPPLYINISIHTRSRHSNR